MGMRLRIRASLGGATWLHPFPPAMKRREIHASLGEATRLHACSPAVEATNSALALERLHTTLRWLFWESFKETSELPVLRIVARSSHPTRDQQSDIPGDVLGLDREEKMNANADAKNTLN